MTEEIKKETGEAEVQTGATQETPKATQDTQTEPDWKGEAAKWKDKHDNLLKESQRRESKISEREKRTELLEGIPERMENLEELFLASAQDTKDAISKLSGETVEPPKPTSRVEQLLQSREAKRHTEPPESAETMSDPEVKAAVRVYGIVEEMGWDADNPIVQKAWKMNTATEALEFLQKEVRKSKDGEVARLVDEGVKKALKDAGLTAGETSQPSGSTRNFAQLEQAYGEGKISTAEYEAAMKQYGKR